ncbi:MAG TPA: UDP-N-acetylmuramoyl-L-alanyl-D-glutamate--2,6-diaminopimelate ligase [Gammaproteobacteria bacterium]
MMTAPILPGTPLAALLGPEAGALASVRIDDLVIDSREARPGAAFVAVRGGRSHGLDFAAEALARGAAVVLYDPDGAGEMPSGVAGRAVAVPRLKGRLGDLARRLYGAALGDVDLAGITGTNGKTTVAYLIAQAMAELGRPCGYIGTLGYGVPPRLTPHALTTPDCFTLHRELIALAAGHSAVEVSSHALAQDRVAGLVFATAAITNLTRDHLDEHGDFEHYGRAKARLFAREGLRCAVLNVNDPFAAHVGATLPPAVRTIRVAAAGARRGANGRSADDALASASAAEADLAAAVTARGLAGLELDVFGRYGEARLVSPLIGGFNAENLLVALGVLVSWDVPLGAACDALGRAAPPPGRLEVVAAGDAGGTAGAPCVVVDYAHTPDGLERALDAVRAPTSGEVWCVFGCGGDRDRGKRAAMGRAAAAGAEHLVLTDDNPRSEDPEQIVRDVLEGVGAHPSVAIEHDRGRAIARAIAAAKPGDVVLIAGKGHETSQWIGTAQRPFSDRAAALDALGERS